MHAHIREQTASQPAVGSEPEPVARFAEMIAHGADEAEGARRPGQAVVARRALALRAWIRQKRTEPGQPAAHFSRGHQSLTGVGHAWPPIFGTLQWHHLDEADVPRVVLREGGKFG